MNTEKPLGYILGQTVHAYKGVIMQAFKEQGVVLSFENFAIMIQLSLNKNLTQQELADELHKDKSIILRQISVLLDNNYVVRTQDENDGRKKNLMLTLKGEEELSKAKQIAKSLGAQLLAGVDSADFQAFRRVAEMIQHNAGFTPTDCRS
ncbi:MarR family winged helix-turn-helix transcriptional regulator [Sunxiuqinia sp. sy24]|uniref:MarR family winged helix-turn-helix transcriptional regulator n=1 Tax=Sunxiuqinia sp. sy24 TaxID=3461495 RepID=UPI0040457BD2